MKYLPALLFGFVLLLMLTLVFAIAANYSLLTAYLTSVPGLNGNSLQWWWLSVHDISITVVTTALVIWLYHRLFSRHAFNLSAILIMQFPLAIVTAVQLIQSNYFFGNIFQSAITVNRLLSLCIVLLIYAVYRLLPSSTRTVQHSSPR